MYLVTALALRLMLFVVVVQHTRFSLSALSFQMDLAAIDFSVSHLFYR